KDLEVRTGASLFDQADRPIDALLSALLVPSLLCEDARGRHFLVRHCRRNKITRCVAAARALPRLVSAPHAGCAPRPITGIASSVADRTSGWRGASATPCARATA